MKQKAFRTDLCLLVTPQLSPWPHCYSGNKFLSYALIGGQSESTAELFRWVTASDSARILADVEKTSKERNRRHWREVLSSHHLRGFSVICAVSVFFTFTSMKHVWQLTVLPEARLANAEDLSQLVQKRGLVTYFSLFLYSRNLPSKTMLWGKNYMRW